MNIHELNKEDSLILNKALKILVDNNVKSMEFDETKFGHLLVKYFTDKESDVL